jgi:fructose-1,6-bisphosphatase/inositol monophosphatase family enzyme
MEHAIETVTLVQYRDREAEVRLQAAARLARLGGRIALDRLGQPRVSWKSDDSMLTDADVAIQQRLEAEIAAQFPHDAVVGEEGSEAAHGAVAPGPARYLWVVDPIDGTNNFGRRLPGFSVSVGVMRGGQPVAGAVFDPLADMLFRARRGCGAWLNGEPLALRPPPLSARSLFAIRSPFEGPVPRFVEGWLRRYRLRRFGSTALHLCYVALGGLAFVHDDRACLWDIAGAAPVLLEAGGVLSRPDGGPLFPLEGPLTGRLAFLAGDARAHAEVLPEVAREPLLRGR